MGKYRWGFGAVEAIIVLLIMAAIYFVFLRSKCEAWHLSDRYECLTYNGKTVCKQLWVCVKE